MSKKTSPNCVALHWSLLCLLPAQACWAQVGMESVGNSDSPSLDTVTISARRSIEDRFMAPGSMVVIDRRDIEALGAFSVSDVLRQLPGVQVTPTGDGSVVIRMRGMDADSTQLLIDGQRVSNGKSQLPIDQLPSEMIERVEVIRAPSAEFTGASGGTINLVLRQATVQRETNLRFTDNHVWGHNAGQAFFSRSGPLPGQAPAPVVAASTDDPTAESPQPAALPVTDKPWAYFVALANTGMLLGSQAHRETDSQGQLTSLTDVTSRYRRSEYSLVPKVNGKWGRADDITLRATISHTFFRGWSSTNSTGVVNATPYLLNSSESYQYQRQYRQGALDWTHRFSDSKLDTTLAASHAHDTVDRLGNTIQSGADAQSSSYMFSDLRRDSSWNLKSKLTGTSSNLLWSGGAELEGRSLRVNTDSADSSLGSNSLLAVGARLQRQVLWGQNEWALNTSTLTAGLRTESLRLSSTDANTLNAQRWTFLQPSVHLRTPIDPNLQWRANLARVTRNPSVWDLINRSYPSGGVNGINNPDYSGNPVLRPEVALTIDTGIERRLGQDGQLGLNLFVRQLKDSIASLVTLRAGRWVQQRSNVGDATVWGLEGDVKSDLRWAGLAPDWTLSSHASLLQSRMTSGPNLGQRIPGQARYQASVNVAKPLRRSGGLFGGGTLTLTGPAQLSTSPGITGAEHPRGTLDLYVGGVLPTLGYWRLGVFNIGNAPFNRQRAYSDASGNATSDYSQLLLTPRVFLSVGTQF
jgi:outer membrane receptor protein involved in Fe transport